jgi:hypothetical protein
MSRESNPPRDDADSDAVTQLLARAGPRSQPPERVRDAVYHTALLAWQDAQTERRRAQRRVYAIAASILAVAVTAVWRLLPLGDNVVVAHRLSGAGAPISVGASVVAEGESGEVLRLQAGQMLRLAGGTQVKFVALNRLRLITGRLYFDSAKAVAPATLPIEVPAGLVTNMGTRYSLELSQGNVVLRVRDGAVVATTRLGDVSVTRGEQVQLNADGVVQDRRRVSRQGAVWRWADELAPPLLLDGRALADVLEEIASETGRQLQFADAQVRSDCVRILLRGPVLDMSPGDRLFAVLVTTGFEAVENGDTILVRRRDSAAELTESRAP